jgi:hypothetical protein
MGFLAISLGIVGAGLLGNLALTFALLRRVRRHDTQLARIPFNLGPTPGLRTGSKVPDLTIQTASGETRPLGGSHNLIGFFSVGCPACEKQLPEFKRYARSIPGGASRAVAIISGNDGAADFARELEGVAAVVLEPPRGSVQQAMSVSVFPMFYLLDADGRVQVTGRAVQRVARASMDPAPELATAREPR